MPARSPWFPLICLVASLILGCTDGDDDDSAVGPDDDDTTAASKEPILPSRGSTSNQAVDCTGAYELPAEFTGDEGLGYHGWELDDLIFTAAWPISTTNRTKWISDMSVNGSSIRVLLETDEVHPSLLHVDLWSRSFRTLEVRRDPDCPTCGQHRFEFLDGDWSAVYGSS